MYIIKERYIYIYTHTIFCILTNGVFFSLVFAVTSNKLRLCDSAHTPDNVYAEF